MGGRGSSFGSGGTNKGNADYKSAYADELNNPNYTYISFYEAVNSSTNPEQRKSIMAYEMKASKDMRGESALKTMNDELKSINNAIKENSTLARDYGIPKGAEKGIKDALKEHKRRIETVISEMHKARNEYEKQLVTSKKNKGKTWRL
ncbi:MAG: hypothetical protein K2J11_10050 [Oscillospiraceae bacterium]|nr:hypothetical protein [Oscillospiraceae bacterium]